jgi:hypothetical protein
MERQHDETEEQYHLRLLAAAQTLTQDQIDACAWVMGGSGCGWTRESVIDALPIVHVHQSEPDESMDGDFDSGMASAGFGTDEDYGGDIEHC